MDPVQRNDFKFAHYPQCKAAYELSPSVDWITVNEVTGQVEVNPTSLKSKGKYDFTLTKKPAYPNIGVSSSFDFTVHLVDQCERATFVGQTIPSLELFMQNDDFR